MRHRSTTPSKRPWRRVASNTTAYLRGVAFFNGHFIAAGSNGAVLTSATAAGPWVARSTGTTATLTAATASDAAAIVVGFGGTILRSAPAVSPPIISAQPTAANAVAGDNVLFSVTATGTLPLAYQWRLNGTPLPGQTADRLFLSDVQPAQAGGYSVSVANAQGVTTSAAAALTFVASTASGPIVDPTFAPTLTFSDNIIAAVEQTDGRLIIGGSNFSVTPGLFPFPLARLNLDGSLDQNYLPPIGGTGSVGSLSLQSDGRLLVGGNFTGSTDTSRKNLIRLNADGSLDPTFTAAPPIVAQPTAQIAQLAGGKILTLNNNTLFLLNADGSRDAAFTPFGNNEQISQIVTIFLPLPNGQILAGDRQTIYRLNANGTKRPDSNFFVITAGGNITRLQLAPDAGLFVTDGATLSRRRPDGTPDSGWAPMRFPFGLFSTALDAQGSIFVAAARQDFVPPRSFVNIPTLVRYFPSGSRDESFDSRAGPNAAISAIIPMRDGRVVVSGRFSTFDGVARPGLARLFASNALSRQAPVIATLTPEAAAVRPGDSVTLTVTAAGSGPLTYRWSDNIPTADRAKSSVPVPTVLSGAYTFTVTVINAVGTVTSAPVRVVVAPSAPVILAQPASIVASASRTAVFTVEAGGSAPFAYQWFRGTTLVGTGSTLTLSNVTAADAGEYSVVVRNSLGATTSSIARLTVDGTPQLVNISTRATAGTGDRALIAGFVIRGAAAKNVVVRGLGPALASFGVAGTLLNPVLTLNDGAGRVVATNDNWSTTATPPALFAGLGAFALANGSADAALQTSLSAGSYTATVSDSANRTGTALVEIYAADANSTRLVNLSTRAFVDIGSGIGIAGIVVRGQQPGRYLVRGIGPALTAFGVGGALADPVLVLTTSLGVTVASNDNWSVNTNAGELANAAAAVGAFPLPANSRDAALLLTLPPGSYTALVSGAANTTGVALVEVYEVP